MIAIDWGTTRLRAYLLDSAGAIVDRQESGGGILGIPAGGFPAALHAAIGPWLAAGGGPVLLCGMVGSRQGWAEAPYLPCPAGPSDIAAALVPLPFGDARCLLVPGLLTRDAAGVPDVMRGEEAKLLGLLDLVGDQAALACLPGTHSKWARLASGRIVGFATHMTGELRATLLAHSILGRMARQDAPGSDAAFLRGAQRSREAGGLLHHIFGTRALALVGDLAEDDAAAYLSGVLIGHEVAAATATESLAGPIHLAGAVTLCRRYALAFDACGLEYRLHDPDLAAYGLARIARSLG